MNGLFLYKKTKISKKNNKFRNIYIPSPEYKDLLSSLTPILNHVYLEKRIFDCDHAFLKNRNCVTNAEKHINNQYVFCLDIENFFESITEELLLRYLPKEILYIVLVEKFIPQGFPTSPILSNIGMIHVDFDIVMALRSIDTNIIYSRYADDITISFNNIKLYEIIKKEIKSILNSYGLNINNNKTSFYNKDKGRAIITGVGVSNTNVHPTRKTLKKIRAAKHQMNLRSYLGLKEWSLCKKPKLPPSL